MTKNPRRTGAAAAINPDSRSMHYLILVLVTLTGLAAVAVSWNGLIYVAEQQQLPSSLLWLTPVMVDIPLIALTLSRGALTKRGIPTAGILVGIFALTTYSSLANLAHTLAVVPAPKDFASGLNTVLGASANALAPWLILAMTEVAWLVLTQSKGAKKVLRTATETAVAETPTAPVLTPKTAHTQAVTTAAQGRLVPPVFTHPRPAAEPSRDAERESVSA